MLAATLESLDTPAARAARRAARTVSPKQRTFLDLERVLVVLDHSRGEIRVLGNPLDLAFPVR